MGARKGKMFPSLALHLHLLLKVGQKSLDLFRRPGNQNTFLNLYV